MNGIHVIGGGGGDVEVRPVGNQSRGQGPETGGLHVSVVSRMGMSEDGRFEMIDQNGMHFAISRLPYFALMSLRRYLTDPSSGPYEIFGMDGDDADIILENLDGRIKTCEKKPVRAFRRLKEKGFWADNVEGLRSLIETKLPMNLSMPLHVLLDMGAGLSGTEGWNATIPDMLWLSAIEMVVYAKHPGVYLNPADGTQWGCYLDEGIAEIWSLVYLFSYIGFLRDVIGRMSGTVQAAKAEAMDRDMARTAIDNMSAQMAKLTAERDELKVASASQARDLSRRLEHETRTNERLKLKIEVLEESAAAAEQELLEFDESELAEEISESDIELFRHELPENNILFVGGHPRLQSQLRNLHPRWKFLTTRMSYSMLNDNIKSDFVFIYTGRLSHKLFDKVRRALPDTAMGYVTSQNMKKLHAEMTELYDRHMRSKEGAE